MKRKILSLVLALAMCLTLLPMAALAADVVATPIYVKDIDTGAFSFDANEATKDEHGQPRIAAYLINTAGELKSDCGGAATIINNVAVTVGEGGRVDTEDLYIFGEYGSLTVNGITFTSEVATYPDDSSVEDVVGIYDENKESLPDAEVSGTAAEISGELNVGTFTVAAGKTLTLKTGAHLSIGGLSITGTLAAEQDAQITVRKDASVSGVTFYDEMGENEWTNFSHDETFNWLSDLNKWVRFAENGDPNAPGKTEFWVDYDNRNDAKVQRTVDSYVFPARGSEKPEHFKQDETYDTLSFTLAPPNDGGEYAPIVEIEIFDAHDDTNGSWVPNTVLSSVGQSPAITLTGNTFSYTPESDTGFIVHVYWSQAEYDFSHFGGQYVVEFCCEGNGSVTVSGDNQRTYGNRTKIAWDEDPGVVAFNVTPNGQGNKLEAVWIEKESNDNDNYNALENGESAFKSSEGYKIDISAFPEGWGGCFANMSFRFTGWKQQNPGPQGPTYEIRYNDRRQKETPQAFVKIGDDILAPYSNHEFTKDSAINFDLYPDPSMTDIDPFVEIEVFNGSAEGEEPFVPNSRYETRREIDDQFKLTMTQEKGVYTVSFTPADESNFSVTVYWNEQDRFDQFGYNDANEFQVRTNVSGNGTVSFSAESDRGTCQFGDDQAKYNYAAAKLPLTVTFTPDTDETLDILVIGDTFYAAEPEEGQQNISALYEENAYKYVITEDVLKEERTDDPGQYRYKDIYIEAHFSGEPGEPGEGGGGQDNPPQGGINWEALESALENYIFAYGGSTLTETQAKELVCKELSERHIGEGLDYALGEALGKNAAALAEFVDVQGNSLNSGAAFAADSGNKVNKPYYSMEIRIEDVDPDTEGNQTFSVQTNVYVLDTVRDIIIESEKNGEKQYQIITLSAEEFGTTCEYINADSIVGVCGNAAMCNGIEGGGEGVFACHVTQEHAGRTQDEITFPIGARLVLTLEQDTIQVSATGSDAAPWSFQNVGVYSGSGTADAPTEATVFVGTDSVTLGAATGSKTITAVEPVGLPASAIEFDSTSKTLNFRTAYDNVEVKITYGDDSTSYMVFNRVGLDINSVTGVKYDDVQSDDRFSPEEKAACTDDSFNVWHGTDQSVRYASTADKVIVGTFYYDDEMVIDKYDAGSGDKYYIGTDHSGTAYDTKAEAVEAYYNGLRHVSLYVTVTRTNGSVEHKIIDSAITMTGNAVNNGGFKTDTDNAPGYAGQGSNHFYDDFVLWSGSEDEFEDVVSVSAIVYESGDDSTFGGVRVGSGAGVVWNNN